MRASRRLPARDWGLTLRMSLVMVLLAGVYLLFLSVLAWAGVNIAFLAVIAGVMLFTQYFFSDRLVLMSMGARLVSPQEAPDLHAMVERLAMQAGIPKPRIAVAPTSIPNAFATGRSPRHSVVCVTTGLLQRLTPEEVEAVLGHELAHIKNRDVMVITFASFFSTLAAMLVNWLMWIGLFGGFGGDHRRNNGALAFLAVWLVSYLTYLLSYLLILALSRYREYAADHVGALLTGAPSRLASALLKISGTMRYIPEEDLRRVEHANAFFFAPALKGASLAELLSTHPPVHKRVERLKRLELMLEGS